MAKSKSQNLSIMMTDIQGYTDKSSASSREDIIGLIRRHNQLMIPVIEFYGGTIIKSIGDAFLCTFPSATDAVVCAIIVQLVLKEYNEKQKDADKKMKLRIVINTGDVSIEQNDIYGEAVNVTARMEGLPCFPGGTIGISESTYLLMNRNEIVADRLGAEELKGIPEKVTVFSVPLDKQKLTSIPGRLLELVERSVNSKGTVTLATEQVAEWSKSVQEFLKEKNWGENISQVQENLKSVQKKISRSFSQKSVLEETGKMKLIDASAKSRFKSFMFDLCLILCVYSLVYFSWWVGQRVLYGSPLVEYDSRLSSMSPSSDQWHEELKKVTDPGNLVFLDGKEYIRRPMGALEWMIDMNVRYPIVLLVFYFAILWKLRGASFGQIATGTAVIKESGEKLNLKDSFKRSVVFVFSNIFFGAGFLMVFVGDKKALYDKVCGTRVVEQQKTKL